VTVNLTISTTSQVLPVTSINGWIVIHSRYSAAYQLDMTWNDYVTGFGDASSSDFWLGLEYIHLQTRVVYFRTYEYSSLDSNVAIFGLEYIHLLTTSANYRLRVEIQAAHNGK